MMPGMPMPIMISIFIMSVLPSDLLMKIDTKIIKELPMNIPKKVPIMESFWLLAQREISGWVAAPTINEEITNAIAEPNGKVADV